MYMTQPDRQRIQHIRDYCEEIRKTIDCYSSPEAVLRGTACRKLIIKRYTDKTVSSMLLATVYKGNIIKNLIMDCQSYTKYRPSETTGGIFVSWRRKEELPTGA